MDMGKLGIAFFHIFYKHIHWSKNHLQPRFLTTCTCFKYLLEASSCFKSSCWQTMMGYTYDGKEVKDVWTHVMVGSAC